MRVGSATHVRRRRDERRDVRADQHDLAVLDDDVGFLDLRATGAYRLHLPAVERDARFEFLLDEVVVIGFSVLDDAHDTCQSAASLRAVHSSNGPMQTREEVGAGAALRRRRCSSSSIGSSSTREFLPWCGGAQVLETRADGKTARIDIDYHGVRAHFTTDNVEPRRRIHRHHAARRPVPPPARRVALLGARARRLQGRARARLRVRDARCSSASVGPVFSHIANTFIDAFVRRAEVRLSREPS